VIPTGCPSEHGISRPLCKTFLLFDERHVVIAKRELCLLECCCSEFTTPISLVVLLCCWWLGPFRQVSYIACVFLCFVVGRTGDRLVGRLLHISAAARHNYIHCTFHVVAQAVCNSRCETGGDLDGKRLLRVQKRTRGGQSATCKETLGGRHLPPRFGAVSSSWASFMRRRELHI
jgi:hypothetical protein